MDVIDKITAIISPSLDAMGYEIVQLKLVDGKRKTLSLMAERKDAKIMSFDDCTDISRTVSALMDVEDPITNAYNLEVCSPGVDRPLVKFSDYERHANYEIKLETLIPVAGRKRFKGTLIAAKDGMIHLRAEEGEADIAFTNIKSAKLLMTDELMRSFLKQQSQQS
jgi:ribosome maturation factor RimP